MIWLKFIANHEKVITNYDSRCLLKITTKFLQIETGI